MTAISRRGLIGGATAAGLGIAFSGSIDAIAGTAHAAGARLRGVRTLVPDPAGILSLPPGFSYQIVSESGVTATADGVPTASDPE